MTALALPLPAFLERLDDALLLQPSRAVLAVLALTDAQLPTTLQTLHHHLADLTPERTLILPYHGLDDETPQLAALNRSRDTLLTTHRLVLLLPTSPQAVRRLRTLTLDLLDTPNLFAELAPERVDRPWSDVDRDLRALMLRLYSHLDLNPLLLPSFSLPRIPWEELAHLEPHRAATLRAARAVPPAPLRLLIPEAPLLVMQRERATPRLDAVVTWLEAQGIEGAHALHDHQAEIKLHIEHEAPVHDPWAQSTLASPVQALLSLPMRFLPDDGDDLIASLRAQLDPITQRIPAPEPERMVSILVEGVLEDCTLGLSELLALDPLEATGWKTPLHSPPHMIAALLILWIEESVPRSTLEVVWRLRAWQEARRKAALY